MASASSKIQSSFSKLMMRLVVCRCRRPQLSHSSTEQQVTLDTVVLTLAPCAFVYSFKVSAKSVTSQVSLAESMEFSYAERQVPILATLKTLYAEFCFTSVRMGQTGSMDATDVHSATGPTLDLPQPFYTPARTDSMSAATVVL